MAHETSTHTPFVFMGIGILLMGAATVYVVSRLRFSIVGSGINPSGRTEGLGS